MQGKVLAQQRTQFVGRRGAPPDRVLMGASEHRDRSDQFAVDVAVAGGRAYRCAGCWPAPSRRRDQTSTPATVWRSRYRATAIGLIGNIGRPVVRSAATNSPR